MRVSTVNNDIAGLEEWYELFDKIVNSLPRLDHQHDLARARQICDQFFYRPAPDDLLTLRSAVDKIVNFGCGSIVARYRKTFAFHIKDEILTHHRQPYQSYIRFCHFFLRMFEILCFCFIILNA